MGANLFIVVILLQLFCLNLQRRRLALIQDFDRRQQALSQRRSAIRRRRRIANLSTAKLEMKATQKLKTADRMKTDAEML